MGLRPVHRLRDGSARGGPALVGWLHWLARMCISDRSTLVAENLALRQQLNVLRRSVKRPRVRWADRVFWAWFSALVRDWRSLLVIFEPATVVRWHREGFRLYWRWKSRGRQPGRPRLSAEVRH